MLKDSEVDDWTSDGREFQGWLQQPETSDGRQILDDVPVRVAGMMLMNADGGNQTGRQHEPTDQGMAEPDRATLGTP